MAITLSSSEEKALLAFSKSKALADSLLKQARYRSLSKGSVFIEQSANTTDVFLLLSGKARAYLLSLEGREMWLATYTPGSLIGEIAILTGAARTASVITTEPTGYLVFEGASFKTLMHQEGALGLIVASMEAERLTDTTAALFSAAIDQIDKRIIKHLGKVGLPFKQDETTAVIHPIPNISELALELGSSRETVSRGVNKLIRLGVISRQTDHLIVKTNAV